MSMGKLPESLSQAMLVGSMLVGGVSATACGRRQDERRAAAAAAAFARAERGPCDAPQKICNTRCIPLKKLLVSGAGCRPSRRALDVRDVYGQKTTAAAAAAAAATTTTTTTTTNNNNNNNIITT